MLFSSQVFLLLFLPLVLFLFHRPWLQRRGQVGLVLVASGLFYAWWDIRFLPLLFALIGANWIIAQCYCSKPRPAIIISGIVLNLAVIGGFKYANFFAESVLTAFGWQFQPWSIILPLGISFFTFQQISYLVDLNRGRARSYPLLDYAAYVSFFPELIAGPIVRHNELIPQFDRLGTSVAAETFARGLTLFILGLVKKVFFADELAPFADQGFDLLAAGGSVDTTLAWQSALAYSLQLYFDFSSYSDMALGLAAMFGLELPLNFDRPYRALNIREFWRRWHMTLSRFFRDYVYIPMGGNQHGLMGICAVAFATMLLCGLWHGAGWTFIAWGALHGGAIAVARVWLKTGVRVPAPAAWLLTMMFVVVGWVLFRAETFEVANAMLVAMTRFEFGAADAKAWWFVAIGAVAACVGPTNVELSCRNALSRYWTAIALGLAIFAVVLRVGQGREIEFIYFQF